MINLAVYINKQREKVQQEISYLFSLYIFAGSLHQQDSGSVVHFMTIKSLFQFNLGIFKLPFL